MHVIQVVNWNPYDFCELADDSPHGSDAVACDGAGILGFGNSHSPEIPCNTLDSVEDNNTAGVGRMGTIVDLVVLSTEDKGAWEEVHSFEHLSRSSQTAPVQVQMAH